MSSNRIDDSAVHENWYKTLSERPERCLQMWTNTEEFGWSHDVTFEVGSVEKVRITAHRLVLATSCKYFEDLFRRNPSASASRETPLPFPHLDPVGFKKTLYYIYSDTVDFSGFGPKEILAVLEAAKVFGLEELVTQSEASLRLQITSDNAVEMFQFAQGKSDQYLEELTRSYISSHINEVLSPARFLKRSEDAVCSLLNIDDWHLNEVGVFDIVKRWAMQVNRSEWSSIPTCTCGVNGMLIRERMGKAFYAIRFPLMKKDEFFQRVLAQENGGLFSGHEIQAFAEYFCGWVSPAGQECLRQFVCRPRLKTLVTLDVEEIDVKEITCKLEDDSDDAHEVTTPIIVSSTSEASAVVEETSCNVENEDNDELLVHAEGNEKRIQDEVTIPVIGSCAFVHIMKDVRSVVNEPPAKKARTENKESTRVDTSSKSASAQTLVGYVNDLGRRKENITIIDETLVLTTLPNIYVQLPNLADVRLRLVSRNFSRISELFSYVKEKNFNLYQLLFFDKDIGSNFSHVTEDNLKTLLNQKVNISVQFDECLLFKVCHKEGFLLLNLLKDAQTICKILQDFPLKKLAINECNLNSVKTLRRDILEIIVIRVAKNERTSKMRYDTEEWKSMEAFVKDCSSLVEFSFNDMVSYEPFYFEDGILQNNPHLRKVSIGNLVLELDTDDFPDWQSSLTELYMRVLWWRGDENCSNYPFVFPLLKRVQFTSLPVGGLLRLLYNILKIRPLNWICMSCYRFGKVTVEKIDELETDEEEIALTFLSKVFHFNPKTEECPPWFILSKKAGPEEPSSEEVFDPFDDTKWTGQNLMYENGSKIIKSVVCENFSWTVFCPKYENLSRGQPRE